MHHDRQRGRTLALLAVGASMLLFARPAGAFDGSQDIALGDSVRATLAGESGETHRFPFFATAGSVLSARVRVTAGDDLVPTLRLIRPGGAEVDVGRDFRPRRRIGDYRFLTSGYFELEVSPAAGSGEYTLATSVRRRTRLGGFVPAPESEGTFRFHAYESAFLVARVRPVRRGRNRARPALTGLTAPDGASIAVTPYARGSASIIRVRSLPQDGLYTLSWESSGAGSLRYDFRFDHRARVRRTWVLGLADGIAARSIEDGDPVLAGRDGYVGSRACGRCHGDLVLSWSRTAHNSAVRAWDRPGLAGEALANEADFRDGLDLSEEPAFAAFGADAPLLSYDAGDDPAVAVTIGSVTYPVHRTMGGNGLWMQRFLTKIGRSYYVLPVQYDEATSGYSGYALDDWYNGTVARYTSAGQVPADISFEAQCSGCHNTGELIEFDAGEFVTGYVEVNVGCEQCHGPGGAHAGSGNPALISNPADLLDGTPEGVARAGGTCGRCHTRGHSLDAVPGSTVRPAYGFSAAGGVQQFGDEPTDFFTPTTDDADFWGRKENPFPPLPGDTFVASRSHQQQALDLAAGAHAPRSGSAPTCFACHDPHSRAREHQVRESIERDGSGIPTRSHDNSLCLACHAGLRGFEGLSPDDVAAIASGTPQTVVRAVVDHMFDIGMPVSVTLYDPVRSGVGRCVGCHMPETARSASGTTDAGGFVAGDVASHTFAAVWPRASELYGVTNSCSGCHPSGPSDPVAAIIGEWVNDGDDADGTFHADTPLTFQNLTANEQRDGGVRCAGCHTTEGFIRIQVEGQVLDQGEIDEIVRDSLARDAGITCRACHGKRANGQLVGGPNPVRFPTAELCGRCHNGRTIVFEDFRDHGAPLDHPAVREMFAGTAGAEVPGGVYGNSPHSSPALFPDGCVNCHFDRAVRTERHHFTPDEATCGRCHQGLDTFDRPAFADFDGSGTVDGIQSEVESLLGILADALLEDPLVSLDARGRFQYDGATDGTMTGASEAQKRAVFNHHTVARDGSLGVHNPIRTVQLLQRSYRELTGEDVPGAFMR